jgi:hypothetical protein
VLHKVLEQEPHKVLEQVLRCNRNRLQERHIHHHSFRRPNVLTVRRFRAIHRFHSHNRLSHLGMKGRKSEQVQERHIRNLQLRRQFSIRSHHKGDLSIHQPCCERVQNAIRNRHHIHRHNRIRCCRIAIRGLAI